MGSPRQVYAIERGPVARVARAVFESNGLAGQVSLIEQEASEAIVPEPIQVIVGELLGDDPFDERVRELFRDAVLRHGVSGVRCIPQEIELFGTLVDVPVDALPDFAVTTRFVASFQNEYGLDLSYLLEVQRHMRDPVVVSPELRRGWTHISEAFLLHRSTLGTTAPLDFFADPAVPVIARASHPALLTYFVASLSDSISISNNPATVSPANHWHCPLWILSAETALEEGQSVRVRYRRKGNTSTCTVDVESV